MKVKNPILSLITKIILLIICMLSLKWALNVELVDSTIEYLTCVIIITNILSIIILIIWIICSFISLLKHLFNDNM